MTIYNNDNPLKVGTLFSGYDSQLLACKRLKEIHPEFDYTCTFWCEIDKYAVAAHNALFPEYQHLNLGDITQVDWSKVSECDLLTYSSPCQDWSSAGLQRGGAEGSETRSSLLWECRKAIEALHPKFLMLENVKALTQSKFAPFLEKWCNELEEYGYIQLEGLPYKKGEYGYNPANPSKRKRYKVLNAKNYGVPQNRERVFVISVRKDVWEEMQYKPTFPEPFPLDKALKDVLEENVEDNFYLSNERIKGLMDSTDAEKLAGRGFKFVPKYPEDTANALSTLCGGGQKNR